MSRYLKVAFFIGAIVALAVLALYHYNLLRPVDGYAQRLLGLPDYMSALRWPYMYGLIPALALAIAWTTVDITRLSLKAVIAVGAFLLVLSTTYVLALYQHFFSPTGPLLAVMLAFIAGMQYSRTTGGRRKKLIRHLFGRRIAEAASRKMVDSGLPASFQGEQVQATILLCEVFNHDALMEKLPPEDYVSMINLHLATASKYLVELGGYLDECDGEGMRVLFGAPIPDEDHAVVAVKAAMGLDQQLKNLNLECDQRWHQTLDYRIGISTGDLITGAFGSSRLGGFSAGGEAVDFTRRLCAANTVFGTRILLGPDTYEKVMDRVEVRPIEMIRRPEDGERIEIYEPIALTGELEEPERRRQGLFWEGIVFYRERRWDLALERFTQVDASCGGDPASLFYIRRIERLQTGAHAPEFSSQRPYGIL